MIISELWNYQKVLEANSQEFQLENTEVYLDEEEISALLVMEDSLWVGGKDGVKRVDYETGEVIDYVVDDVELIYAASMVVSSKDGSVWIGHNDGVTILLEDGQRLDYAQPDITGGRVNTILETDSGIYVGTMQGCSVFQYVEGVWSVSEMYDEDSGLAADPVNVLTEINGSIWFGSYLDSDPGGISILDETGAWSYLTIEEGLPHPYINAIIEGDDEQIYVGTGQLTYGGLAEIISVDGGYSIVDTYDVMDNIPGEKIRQLYIDDSGIFWITTESDGLIITQGTEGIAHPIEGVQLSMNNGLSDNEIKCIVESSDAYWLGGRYGLTCIAKDTIYKLIEEGEDYE